MPRDGISWPRCVIHGRGFVVCVGVEETYNKTELSKWARARCRRGHARASVSGDLRHAPVWRGQPRERRAGQHTSLTGREDPPLGTVGMHDCCSGTNEVGGRRAHRVPFHGQLPVSLADLIVTRTLLQAERGVVVLPSSSSHLSLRRCTLLNLAVWKKRTRSFSTCQSSCHNQV